METNQSIKDLSEQTLTSALKWAENKFQFENVMTKEETILLERIVMISAEIVRNED